jgi:hypothetical protein
MIKVYVSVAVALTLLAAPISAQQAPVVEVYKTPTCGCCNHWVKHLREHGFTVRTVDLNDLSELKTRYKVPPQAQSCHTGIVNGYVVEGHVPAADVHRLLKERPADVAGIAVGGMPIGSPGMEVPGTKAAAYDVVAFDKQGKTRRFSSYGR